MSRLDHHQQLALRWLSSVPKAIVALEQGLGKTIVGSVDLDPPCHVICPSSMKYTWQAELAIWRPELKTQVFGAAKEPVQNVDVWITSYDAATKVQLPKTKTLIIDEGHYLKSPTAKRTAAISEIIERTPKVRVLTGTPVVNRPIELWPVLYTIGATKLGWFEFGLRYCAGWKTPWDTWDFTGLSNEEGLQAVLSSCMIRMTKANWLKDLPPKIYRVFELDLPVDRREKNLDIEDIEAGSKVAFEAISDILKMNAERKLPQAIQHIKDALETEPKVVVFANHTAIIDALREALKDFGVVYINGSVDAKRRHQAVAKFQEDPKCRVFIGNFKAAGVGITLTAARRVIFVESSWTPADIEQAADRCHRRGQEHTVLVDILTIHRSIDAQMLHSVIEKMGLINRVIKETDMSQAQPNWSAVAAALHALAAAFEGQAITAAAEAPGKSEAPEPETKPEPKPTKPAKETKAAASKPSAEEAQPAAKVDAPSEKESTSITLDNLRSQLASLIADGKRDEGLAVVNKYGANKLSELAIKDFPAVMAELQALAL